MRVLSTTYAVALAYLCLLHVTPVEAEVILVSCETSKGMIKIDVSSTRTFLFTYSQNVA